MDGCSSVCAWVFGSQRQKEKCVCVCVCEPTIRGGWFRLACFGSGSGGLQWSSPTWFLNTPHRFLFLVAAHRCTFCCCCGWVPKFLCSLFVSPSFPRFPPWILSKIRRPWIAVRCLPVLLSVLIRLFRLWITSHSSPRFLLIRVCSFPLSARKRDSFVVFFFWGGGGSFQSEVLIWPRCDSSVLQPISRCALSCILSRFPWLRLFLPHCDFSVFLSLSLSQLHHHRSDHIVGLVCRWIRDILFTFGYGGYP